MGVPETVYFTDFLTIAQRVCIPFKNDCHAPNSKVETVQLQVSFFTSIKILIIIYTIFVNRNLPHTQGRQWLFRDTLVGHVIWGIRSRKKDRWSQPQATRRSFDWCHTLWQKTPTTLTTVYVPATQSISIFNGSFQASPSSSNQPCENFSETKSKQDRHSYGTASARSRQIKVRER